MIFTHPSGNWNKRNTGIEFERNTPNRKTGDYDFTPYEQRIIDRATETFDDKVSAALKMLRDEYEYQTSREAIVEAIEVNDYDFDEDGNLA